MQTYILPAVLGAVIIQPIVQLKQYRIVAIAFAVAVIVVLSVGAFARGLAPFSTAIAVLITVFLAWITRKKEADAVAAEEVI